MAKNRSSLKIFGAMYFCLFITRIMVLTTTFPTSINPVLIEMLYIVLLSFVILSSLGGRIRKPKFSRNSHAWFALTLLFLHCIVWGLVLVNDRMIEFVQSMYKSQIIGFLIVAVTLWAISEFNGAEIFLKACFSALAIMLLFHLLFNLSDLDLSNIKSIMDATGRTRANFGFGHYNALGGACVCTIILCDFLPKEKYTKVLRRAICVMAIIMLLCSASRSSITGLLVYYVVRFSANLDESHFSHKTVIAIKSAEIVGVIGLIVFASNLNIVDIITQAQRGHLFETTLPLFFASGNTLFGYGYATNSAFGMGLTPYTTYWLDNGYIYVLIGTGIIGLSVIILAIIGILQGIHACGKRVWIRMVPVLAVFLYTNLFEANLFNFGVITNYVYVVWMLMAAFGLINGLYEREIAYVEKRN